MKSRHDTCYNPKLKHGRINKLFGAEYQCPHQLVYWLYFCWLKVLVSLLHDLFRATVRFRIRLQILSGYLLWSEYSAFLFDLSFLMLWQIQFSDMISSCALQHKNSPKSQFTMSIRASRRKPLFKHCFYSHYESFQHAAYYRRLIWGNFKRSCQKACFQQIFQFPSGINTLSATLFSPSNLFSITDMKIFILWQKQFYSRKLDIIFMNVEIESLLQEGFIAFDLSLKYNRDFS